MGKLNPRYANGTARRKIREAIKKRGDPCALCGRPIDYSLPYAHPMSFEVDEIIPVSRWREYGYSSAKACALDVRNCQPSHRICNLKKSNKIVEPKTMDKPLSLPLSRTW